MTILATVTIPGKPVAKGRPRAYRRGQRAAVFTPEKTVAFENLVTMCAMSQFDDGPLSCALSVEIDAYWPMKGQPLKTSLRPRARKSTAPDADNVAKAVLDGLQGVVYADDSIVVELTVRKWYAAQGDSPRTEVTIREAP